MADPRLPVVPLVRTGVAATSADRQQIAAVDGTPLALVDQAPSLLATLTVQAARAAGPAEPPPPELLTHAGELFATAELGGYGPGEYCELQARASGIPVGVARLCLEEIRDACAWAGERTLAERPTGAGIPAEGTIGSVWVRRGEVLSVVAPSNHPTVHASWIDAVALGYRLIVRPGAGDPFTPTRLVQALLQAGVEPASLSLLPGPHATADTLVMQADLSIVFGSDATVARHRADRSVIPNGPGRSKIVHTGTLTEQQLDVIARSVAFDAGMRCTNASAVFTDGDPRQLAELLADRLATMTAAPPQNPEAGLPVLPRDAATTLRAAADRTDAVEVTATRYRDEGVADLGDGTGALRPAVMLCDRPDHPGASIELPFPCVWVLPYTREDAAVPLRNTLALTVLGDDESLSRAALAEPSIRKVLAGPIPTYAMGPTSPHDGFLSHQLMEARAYGSAVPA